MLAGQDLRRSGRTLATGALILVLASSCASWHGKATKGKAGVARAPAPAAANASAPQAAAPSGRFIARATVEDADSTQTASSRRELAGQAPAAPPAEAGPTPAETPASAGAIGGGIGAPIAAAERRVGVVRVIGAHGKFVLVETATGYGGVPLDEGLELHCRGSAAGGGVQTAVLKVSREHYEAYLVADVVSGQPQAGDVAYFTVERRKDPGPATR